MISVNTEMVHELKDILGDDFSVFLETFLNDLETRCQALEQQVSGEMAEEVRQTAHSLKGSTSNVGAKELTQLCGELEDHAAKSDLGEAKEILKKILKAKDQVINDLSEVS